MWKYLSAFRSDVLPSLRLGIALRDATSLVPMFFSAIVKVKADVALRSFACVVAISPPMPCHDETSVIPVSSNEARPAIEDFCECEAVAESSIQSDAPRRKALPISPSAQRSAWADW